MMEETFIVNGEIIDGTNTPPYRANLRLREGKIADIGMFNPSGDAQVINAEGQYVTPGFIDIHRHCDHAVFKEDFGRIELTQGITTAISGQCGLTPYPATEPHKDSLFEFLSFCMGRPAENAAYGSYAAYRASLREVNVPIKMHSFIGSCAVRIALKGFTPSAFTPEELQEAQRIVADAMDHDAMGLSLGLMYYPEYFSTRVELTTLAKTVAAKGGLLSVHMRNEGDRLPEAVTEAVSIAEAAGISLEISHFKSCGANGRREKLHEAIDIIETYRRRGTNIHADFYPYDFGATSIQSLIPPSCMKETPAETFACMATREGAQVLEDALRKPHEGWDNYLLSLGFDGIIIASARYERNEAYVGKTLQAICDEKDADPYAFISGLMADEEGQTGIFVKSMSPEDVDTVAALPWSMVASDALYPETGLAHPRAVGTFPKILREFVNERAVLPLQTAVHKMTGMPALKMRLTDKGEIRRNAAADICVFDPAGNLSHVLVNGKIKYKEGMII